MTQQKKDTKAGESRVYTSLGSSISHRNWQVRIF
jgi:hypothetical protein